MQVKLLDLETAFPPSILTKIHDAFLARKGVELWLKRDDLLHPVVSGNKWRKLKYTLDHALSLGIGTLVSMGGNHSNHLHALAYVGAALGLGTVGYVRGECPEPLSPTLADLQHFGMELAFVTRTDYRHLREYQSWDSLPCLKSGQYWIPEGGAGKLALHGVAEMVREIDIAYDVICVACGTGATMAGIIKAVPGETKVLGIAALKNGGFLNGEIEKLLGQPYGNWQLCLDYHFGGFAKVQPELLAFMHDFEAKTGILIEPLYTGKMLYALYDLIGKGYFERGQRLVAVHTGGLQGRRGLAGNY
jgi:1-aminocyclopropane-1-carboxylate deaminase